MDDGGRSSHRVSRESAVAIEKLRFMTQCAMMSFPDAELAVTVANHRHSANPARSAYNELKQRWSMTGLTPLSSDATAVSALSEMKRRQGELERAGSTIKRRRVDSSATPAVVVGAMLHRSNPQVVYALQEAVAQRLHGDTSQNLGTKLWTAFKVDPLPEVLDSLDRSVGRLATWLKLIQDDLGELNSGVDLLARILSMIPKHEDYNTNDAGTHAHPGRNMIVDLTPVTPTSNRIGNSHGNSTTNHSQLPPLQPRSQVEDELIRSVSIIIEQRMADATNSEQTIKQSEAQCRASASSMNSFIARELFSRTDQGECGDVAIIRANRTLFHSVDSDISRTRREFDAADAIIQREQTKLQETESAIHFFKSARDLAQRVLDLRSSEVRRN